MELAFPWPTSQGEWLAWSAAVATVLVGLFLLFAPRLALRGLGLQTAQHRPDAVASVRGLVAGFPIAIGLAAVLLAQPLLHMALGFAWLMAGFGTLVAMLSDRAGSLRNVVLFVLELLLAGMALGFSFGFVP
jgi:hypothetical protein